ncbi:MAG: hypothetical protein Q8M94_15175, partial [Ignavibacteria bacterium]|nr:hypothetical protein [Ignavibacteria bacterium]
MIQYVQIKNVPSISAGLLENGEITWLNAFGKADIENNVTITNNAVLTLNSNGKSGGAGQIVITAANWTIDPG